MRSFKHQVIAAGFGVLGATGLHRVLEGVTGGVGAILTLHHVRPSAERAFAPNHLLEVTPSYLDAVLSRLRELELDVVSMDEAIGRIGAPASRRFVVLTFDDGYRDLVEHAVPILRRHQAPFTAFVTSGFADRSARLWWVELEEAVRALDQIRFADGGHVDVLPSRTTAEKDHAFKRIYRALRSRSEDDLLDGVSSLADQADLDGAALVSRLCLDWAGIKALARDPLCTIGAHTVSHPRLAWLDAARARGEMEDGRRRVVEAIGLPVRHMAYPIGDPGSAGPRDYALAREVGFTAAVTTRPGLLFPQHAGRLWSLPRVSLNGLWQDLRALDILLSGVPFPLWNKGRLVIG